MSKGNSDFAWVFAAIGLAGAGFAAGLHRLVWLLFWVLTIIWVGFFYTMIQREHTASLSLAAQGIPTNDDQTIYWVIAAGAPIVVAIILRIVEGVVFALVGDSRKAH
jgi:MFS superfamily sulfate permease-like transporter